jgi:hypothetical protein
LSRFKRYFVGSYVPTLMHALFHLMGVLLAFIMASAWNARESDLRDYRTQLAVLNALRDEANFLEATADSLTKRPIIGKCSDLLFAEDKKPVFQTPVWLGVYVSENALVIGSALYEDIKETYRQLDSAPRLAGLIADNEKCQEFFNERKQMLDRLVDTMNANIKVARDQMQALDAALWSPRYDVFIKVTFLTWVFIILSPLLVYAAELAWGTWVTDRLAAIQAPVVYARVTGVLLLLFVGLSSLISHAWFASRPHVVYAVFDLVGGVCGISLGFWGSKARIYAQVSGIGYACLGIFTLFSGPPVPGLPAAANAVASILHVLIGLWGIRVGFGKERAPASAN